ncbi:MAG: aminotransferase class I/II-fold pyridoxal phosphate-dependent enzyme [Myxococcota bacterium]
MYDVIDQIITDGVGRGIAHLSARDEQIDGRTIHISGRRVLNYGSASYLSLERHPAIMAGVEDGLRRYGTQFASSRVYLSLGMYEQLESEVGKMVGRPVVVTPSTTLGHMSAVPVLVSDNDAVVLDHQVHNSLQIAVQLLKARGVPIVMIRHNRMDQLEREIKRLKADHDKVWYFADGVYSMHGDGAPLDELAALHEQYDQLWSYVDDAHGFGWAGRNGCGWVASKITMPEQMVLAVSLNKSFAAAGGALAFPTEELARRVRTCGGPLIFSGPIQPPMLGAALASARLHLSPEIVPLQIDLKQRIAHAREGIEQRGLPQLVSNDTPLFFVPTGLPRLVYAASERLLADGFYVNQGSFPAVPMNQGGLRFHVHRGLSFQEIDDLLDRMRDHLFDVFREEGVTPHDLARTFRDPSIAELNFERSRLKVVESNEPSLNLRHYGSIAEIPAEKWDALFADKGPMSHSVLRDLEGPFVDAPADTCQADMHYVLVEDAQGHPVLATFYGVTRVKADMLSSAEISEKVEAIRQRDPDFLVSPAVVLGNPMSLGPHLQLDRSHPDWSEALALLVDDMQRVKREVGATQVLLREFPRGEDEQLRKILLDLGFVETSMPDMMMVDEMAWADRDGFLATLGQRYRYNVRREFLPAMEGLRVDDSTTDDPKIIEACYQLYRRVHARGHRLNVMPLPLGVFEAMFANPEFDVVRLYEPGQADLHRPVGVFISHERGVRCTALLVGFDQAHVTSHSIYKVCLLHMVERARAHGATSLNLAYTAELIKKKLGARPAANSAFVMLDDTYSASVLANL